MAVEELIDAKKPADSAVKPFSPKADQGYGLLHVHQPGMVTGDTGGMFVCVVCIVTCNWDSLEAAERREMGVLQESLDSENDLLDLFTGFPRVAQHQCSSSIALANLREVGGVHGLLRR